jgi:hypothetical protein
MVVRLSKWERGQARNHSFHVQGAADILRTTSCHYSMPEYRNVGIVIAQCGRQLGIAELIMNSTASNGLQSSTLSGQC